MKVSHLDYTRLDLWSQTDLAYINRHPSLDPFISYAPDKSVFQEIINQRKKFPVDRPLLLRTLKKQYERLGLSLPVEDKMILNENTFSVTTSHQPTLFTGPLFHIYKIASTIHLVNELKASYPDLFFIPVFVVSGEDHDWEEINHFFLFNKKYEWERAASGAVGHLSLEGLDELIQKMGDLFSNSPFGSEMTLLLKACLLKANTYNEFHQLLIHGLFGRHGLIVLSLDDPDLKGSFIPWMEKEIREQFSGQYVPKTQKDLERAGFKAQAFCRPVNLFYMTDQRRERLDAIEGGLVRVDTGIRYSMEEVVAELHSHPDRFSPNVILRPLYQETILPNLAFIGGGGEIAYWLERKSQFEAAGIHFPMLIRRNSLMMVDEATVGQLKKAGLNWEDLLSDYDSIVKAYLHSHSQTDLHFEAELDMVRQAYLLLSQKAEKIDPTLAKAILAEESKHTKQFEQLGSRLIRAEKQLQETNLKRIQKWKDKLFPGGGLQERHDNFLSYYAHYGPSWIAAMIEVCNPLEVNFTVVELEG